MTPTRLVNSKGAKHVPSSKILDQVLDANDDEYIDFINRCLEWDPKKRMTPNEALQHPWLMAD